MNIDLDPEQQNTLNDQDLAFVESDAGEFNGQKLYKFSAMRWAAAQAIGLKIIQANQENPSDNNIYGGLLFDAIIVVYLSISDELEVIKACRNPANAVARALKWADENNICPGTDSFTKAVQIFSTILKSMADSKVKPEESGGTDPGN